MESSAHSETVTGNSVLELFKFKVMEAVDLVKNIAVEDKGAAWQFWTDVSITLKSLTGSDYVNVRPESVQLEASHSNDVCTASKEGDYLSAYEKLCDKEEIDLKTEHLKDVEGLSSEVDLVTDPEPTVLDSVENVIESESSKLRADNKPKRTRGRPRKIPKSIEPNNTIYSESSEGSHPVLNDSTTDAIKSSICQLCGQNTSSTPKDEDASNELCTSCGLSLTSRRRTRRKPAHLSEYVEYSSSGKPDRNPEKEASDEQNDTGQQDEVEESKLEESENVVCEEDPDWKTGKQDGEVSGQTEINTYDEEDSPVKRGRKRQLSIPPGKTKCDICHVVLSHESALEVHMRKHSGEKPFSCSICGKSFTTKCNMQRHEQTHSGLKPFKCEECGKRFTEKKSVKVHMRSHTGEKPYKCKICGRCFTQMGILQTHMDLHSGRKGHLCDYCGKAFRQKCQLKTHQKRHSSIRSFQCSYCDLSFVNKGDLDRHVLKHTGEKPFLCIICPKRFTRLQYLKEHMNTHTGYKPYSCKLCDASFYDLSTFHRHRRKHKHEETREKEENKILYTVDQLANPGVTTLINDQSQVTTSISDVNAQIALHSIITQNAAGEYELQYVDQQIVDSANCIKADGQQLIVQNSDELKDAGNVTLLVKEKDEEASDTTNILLSAEDLNRLQGVQEVTDLQLTDTGEDLTQLTETFGNTRYLATTNDGQTYHVTYVDSNTLAHAQQVITEDDISAINLLASASQQQL